MSELKLQGKIKNILPLETGTTQAGKEWKKQVFVISNNGGYEGKEQQFAFEVFGTEKVDNFNQYNKEGKEVEVFFNIGCNEWKGKYYTSLQAWKVMSVQTAPQQDLPPLEELNDDEPEDLPFN